MSPITTRAERRHAARLVYAHARCECGALYAYDPREKPRPHSWDCSDIILGFAVPAGQPGAVRHDDTMPFIFWKVTEAPRDWALAHRQGPSDASPVSRHGRLRRLLRWT